MQINKVRNGKVIKRLDIPIHQSCYGGITKSELMESVEKENQLAQQDLKMERTKDKKNALESYVYEMRDKVHFTFNCFIILPILQALRTQLNNTIMQADSEYVPEFCFCGRQGRNL